MSRDSEKLKETRKSIEKCQGTEEYSKPIYLKKSGIKKFKFKNKIFQILIKYKTIKNSRT